jgi:hypothetical protein
MRKCRNGSFVMLTGPINIGRRQPRFFEFAYAGLTRVSISFEEIPSKEDGWPGLRLAEGASAPQAGQAGP